MSEGSLKPGELSTASPDMSEEYHTAKWIVSSNMSHVHKKHPKQSLTTSASSSHKNTLGPLFDYVALYYAILISHIRVMCPHIRPDWDGVLDPIPNSLGCSTLCQ